MVFQSGAKDAHVSQAMKNFHTESVKQARNAKVDVNKKQDKQE
jgi:hypothetical protein